MSNIKLIISIDYSLESTGITFYDSVDSKYLFVSFINTAEKQVKDRLKLLYNVDDLIIIPYKREKIASVKNTSLQDWSRKHIGNCVSYNNILFDNLKKILSEKFKKFKKEDIAVVLENYSYGSFSDNLIQIVENTMSLKYNLINNDLVEIENFYIFPAPTIKKHAGGGNFDKFQMLEKFFENSLKEEPLKMNKFLIFLKENKESFIKEKTKKGNIYNEILSPISDIVDSYWLTNYFLERFLK